LLLTVLTACKQQKENEENIIDDWTGYYVHSGKSSQGSFINMNLLIYSEGENCYGYFNFEDYGNQDDLSNRQGRMLLDIRGNYDKIDLYFNESITEDGGLQALLNSGQTGDLLFSLSREDGEISTEWQKLLPDEREEDLRRGFIRRDEMTPLTLIDENDLAHFLKAKDISEQEQPFYQYYNDDGELQLDFYYDMTRGAGTGIFYDRFQGQLTMCGFDIGSWNEGEWDDYAFPVKPETGDSSQVEDYEEEHIYNEQGQLVSFCSYGVITDRKEPVREKFMEIVYSYREDGTIYKQTCYYNGRLYNATGRTGIYYYDKQERLEYADTYITHGYLEDYYIYDGDSKNPAFCLTLDHVSGQTWAIGFMKYLPQAEEINPDKIMYQLERREYDETVYEDAVMERVLSYIETYPKDSEGSPSIEGELYREWLKQTAIFRIDSLDDDHISLLINDYLKQQGINDTTPAAITCYNGEPFIRHYEDNKSGKIAFVADGLDPGASSKYIYCGVAYREDLKKAGSLTCDFDQKGKLLAEKFYNNQEDQITAISYTYSENIPFPVITKYDNSLGEDGRFFSAPYLNTGQRFWLYDDFIEYDENDRWIRYNGNIFNDFMSENGIESYNTPVYSEEGRLEKIAETLRGSHYQDNSDEWVEDGEIEFRYSSTGSLAEVAYGGFSGHHGSSGNTGTVYYDETGRVMYIDSFHSSGNYNYFYLYQNNEIYPYAIFSIGGIPYSGEEFDGYELIFGMDFDVWMMLTE